MPALIAEAGGDRVMLERLSFPKPRMGNKAFCIALYNIINTTVRA
jgi:hypothetical protein